MLFLLIGVGVLVLVWISLLAAAEFGNDGNPAWTALKAERAKVQKTLQRFVAERKARSPERCLVDFDHDRSSDLLEAIGTGQYQEALALAEETMAAERENPETHLMLAMALLRNGDLEPAASQVKTAQDQGAEGPLTSYLASRIEIEQYLLGIAETTQSSANSILMPVEMLALELHVRLGESGDTTSLWLPGQEAEISKEEAREFVLVHFSGYYRLLDSMIRSQTEMEFADGMYHLARLALKCGFSEEGGALLLCLEEVMSKSTEHKAYRRDLALLRGERPATSETTSDTGRKVVKLKVLN